VADSFLLSLIYVEEPPESELGPENCVQGYESPMSYG
jgi:hypothetical protein